MKTQYYSTTEVADILNISNRAVIKRCVKSKVKKKNKVYKVPQSTLDEWQNHRSKSTLKVVREPVRNSVPNQAMDENVLLQERIQVLAQSNKKILEVLGRLNNELASLKKSTRTSENQNQEFLQEEEPEYPIIDRIEYNSVHPPNTTEKNKDGKDVPKPSMNDVNFVSSYNPNWNKDADY